MVYNSKQNIHVHVHILSQMAKLDRKLHVSRKIKFLNPYGNPGLKILISLKLIYIVHFFLFIRIYYYKGLKVFFQEVVQLYVNLIYKHIDITGPH